MRIPISVLVVTKGAGAVLPRCLGALSAFDEVVVIDTPTGDATAEIALEQGAAYIPYQWNGQYPKKRQWCLDTLPLKHDWVLFVDADEVVTGALVEELSTLFCVPDLIRDPGASCAGSRIKSGTQGVCGYFVSGQYVWNGRLLEHGLRNNKIALLDRRKMMFPVVGDLDCQGMGEIEGHYQPVLREPHPLPNPSPLGRGVIGRISAPLLHYANHSPEEWGERHLRYAAWERCMNRKGAWPEDPVMWRNIMKKVLRESRLKPYVAFLHSYVLKRGFMDGAAGLDFARSRYVYYKMIRRGGPGTE